MIKQANIILSISAAAMLSPAAAMASPFFQHLGGAFGVITHPSQVSGDLLRGDVQRTVNAASKDGSLANPSRGGVVPVKATGPSKSREEVQREFLEMTPQEKARLKEMHGG